MASVLSLAIERLIGPGDQTVKPGSFAESL
jgi:hypothetical protein